MRVWQKILFSTVGLSVGFGAAPIARADTDSSALRARVSAPLIFSEQRVLQQIATIRSGTRASGTRGYGLSADFVAAALQSAGYNVARQRFEFPLFEQLSPPELQRLAPSARTYEAGSEEAEPEVATMEYSGSGTSRVPLSSPEASRSRPPRSRA